MPLWAGLLVGLPTLVGGIILLVITRMSRKGTLARNTTVGIRIKSTLASDEAWLVAHRKTWLVSACITAIMLIGGILIMVVPFHSEVAFLVVVAVTYVSIIPFFDIRSSLGR